MWERDVPIARSCIVCQEPTDKLTTAQKDVATPTSYNSIHHVLRALRAEVVLVPSVTQGRFLATNVNGQ